MGERAIFPFFFSPFLSFFSFCGMGRIAVHGLAKAAAAAVFVVDAAVILLRALVVPRAVDRRARMGQDGHVGAHACQQRRVQVSKGQVIRQRRTPAQAPHPDEGGCMYACMYICTRVCLCVWSSACVCRHVCVFVFLSLSLCEATRGHTYSAMTVPHGSITCSGTARMVICESPRVSRRVGVPMIKREGCAGACP